MPRFDWLFAFALVLYSVVIWTHWLRREKQPKLQAWMLFVFGTAFGMDVLATIFVCILNAKSWQWNVHTVSGLSAVLIMGLHFVWALDATLRTRGKCLELFNRFSLLAWCVWLLSFVRGIPRH